MPKGICYNANRQERRKCSLWHAKSPGVATSGAFLFRCGKVASLVMVVEVIHPHQIIRLLMQVVAVLLEEVVQVVHLEVLVVLLAEGQSVLMEVAVQVVLILSRCTAVHQHEIVLVEHNLQAQSHSHKVKDLHQVQSQPLDHPVQIPKLSKSKVKKLEKQYMKS